MVEPASDYFVDFQLVAFPYSPNFHNLDFLRGEQAVDYPYAFVACIKLVEPAQVHVVFVSKSGDDAKRGKNYKDSLVVQLPEGEKGKVKAFCALKGISLTDFVYYSLEYVMSKSEQGEMTVGKYGLRETPKII